MNKNYNIESFHKQLDIVFNELKTQYPEMFFGTPENKALYPEFYKELDKALNKKLKEYLK